MSDQQKSITIVTPTTFDDLKVWLQEAVQKGNTRPAFFCTHLNTKLTLTARLYDVTGDCGRSKYSFNLFLYRGDMLIFDSDPLYDEKYVIEAFTTFAGFDEDVQFYVATTKEDK